MKEDKVKKEKQESKVDVSECKKEKSLRKEDQPTKSRNNMLNQNQENQSSDVNLFKEEEKTLERRMTEVET